MQRATGVPVGPLVAELERRLQNVVEDEVLDFQPQKDRDDCASPTIQVHESPARFRPRANLTAGRPDNTVTGVTSPIWKLR